MEPFDINNYRRPTDETSILANFSDANPKYDILHGSFIIYNGSAITAVTDGIKRWTIIYPADIDAADLSGSDDLSINPSDTTVGFPRNMQRLWADAVILDWKETQDRPIKLNRNEQLWETRFQEQMSVLRDTNVDEMVGLVGEDPWTQPEREAGFNL